MNNLSLAFLFEDFKQFFLLANAKLEKKELYQHIQISAYVTFYMHILGWMGFQALYFSVSRYSSIRVALFSRSLVYATKTSLFTFYEILACDEMGARVPFKSCFILEFPY